MKKAIALVLLAALLLSLTACGAGGEGGADELTIPEGMQLAEQGDGYTLFAPAGWVIDRSTGITTAYASPIDPSSITLVRTRTDRTPAEYFADSEARLATLFGEYALDPIKSSDKTTFGGKPAIVRVYSGKLLDTPYTVKQYLCREGEYIYLFTYTAKNEIPSGDATYFAQHEEKVDAVAAAFLFSGAATPPEASEPETPVRNEDGLILISDPAVSRYSLYVPEGWTADLKNGTTSATREGAVLSFSYEIPMENNLLEVWETRNEHYKTLYESYTLLPGECSTNAGGPEGITVMLGEEQAMRCVFTFTRGGITYKTQKIMTLDGIYACTLTYTAVYTGDGQDPYTAYLSDLDAILRAFTFD